MKNKHTLMVMFLFLFTGTYLKLQAQLTPGDIAFVGFNSDEPESFAIVTLNQIPENQIIYFTDKGWISSGSLRGYEEILQWTIPSGGIQQNTIVTFKNISGWISSVGLTAGGLGLSDSGDQILAFTGSVDSPNFIAAIQFDSSGWSDATDAATTALPEGLTDDSTAVAIPETDNALYCGPVTGIKTEILLLLNNPDYWYGKNTQTFDLDPVFFPFDVFSGTAGTNWNTATNWTSLSIPDLTVSVIIPDGRKTNLEGAPSAHCKNLFVDPDGYLTIEQNQSLLVENNLFIVSKTITKTGGINCRGTITVNGISSVERYMDGECWHIISSPISGQTLGNFVSNTNNLVHFETTYNDYDLAPYNETTDEWLPYTTASNTTNMQPAKGFVMQRTEDGNVIFTGQLNTENKSIDIYRTNHGWNCIGNPFPSAITGAANFLTLNANQLDTAFSAIYVWDPADNSGAGDYDTRPAFSTEKLAIGQGFIVKSKTEGGTITFTNDLITDVSGTFKSVETEPAFIKLTAQTDVYSNSTEIYFDSEMTTGLDPLYDAGKLKGNPDFSLYTKLINDNGIDYAVQALPDNPGEFRIPVGLDFKTGGEVTFSAIWAELPTGFDIILEDSETKTFTPIDEEGAFYSTFVSSGNTGTGRFYLLTNENQITSLKDFSENKFSAYYSQGTIYIIGNVLKNTQFKLYSIDGKIKSIKIAESVNLNSIDVGTVPSGIYLLKIETGLQNQTIKIAISN